jgi:hypothetical protein
MALNFSSSIVFIENPLFDEPVTFTKSFLAANASYFHKDLKISIQIHDFAYNYLESPRQSRGDSKSLIEHDEKTVF